LEEVVGIRKLVELELPAPDGVDLFGNHDAFPSAAFPGAEQNGTPWLSFVRIRLWVNSFVPATTMLP
jgi:hypothetical protein